MFVGVREAAEVTLLLYVNKQLQLRNTLGAFTK